MNIEAKLDQFAKLAQTFPEFRYLGDPVLRTKCDEVAVAEGVEIGRKLGNILVKYRGLVGYGRGLAAPQIGLAKAVFVTYLHDEVQIYINPKIISSTDKHVLYRELCLSSGIMWADVKRPAAVTMQWADSGGNLQEQQATDTLARLWQHEHDHLQGIPNLDIAVPGTIEICLSDPLQEKIRPA